MRPQRTLFVTARIIVGLQQTEVRHQIQWLEFDRFAGMQQGFLMPAEETTAAWFA
jgi:hypothetical protein